MLDILNIAQTEEAWLDPPSFTGPGPQEPKGRNATAGFFGEVPVDDLIDGLELTSLIGLTSGTAQNHTSPWLKFFIDDRIVFVAKQTYRYSITWNHLSNANVVDGNRVITIGYYQYRIRLLKGLGPDTTRFATNTYDNPATRRSEWNRLLYNICEEHTNPDRHKTSQIGENWVTYTQDDLNITAGNGCASWCQEASLSSSTHHIVRGDTAVTYLFSNSSSAVANVIGWRPVLELIDPTKLLYPPEDIFYRTDFVKNPRITDWYYSD